MRASKVALVVVAPLTLVATWIASGALARTPPPDLGGPMRVPTASGPTPTDSAAPGSTATSPSTFPSSTSRPPIAAGADTIPPADPPLAGDDDPDTDDPDDDDDPDTDGPETDCPDDSDGGDDSDGRPDPDGDGG